MSNKRWTAKEIDWLKENYHPKKREEIAAELGVSLNSLAAKVKENGIARNLPKLTKRERQILKYLTKGFSISEAAIKAEISVSLAEKTIFNSKQKYGAKTTIHLISILKDKNIL